MQGSSHLVRHHRESDRDGHALHVVQGRVQQEEQSAEPGDDQVLKPVHGDCGVQLA